jgi:hypothetical protein
MDTSSGDATFNLLIDRLPADVAATLTDRQRAALWQAIKPMSWRRHPINIRLSLRLPGGRYFLTVVGGPEKRDDGRLSRERRMFPLRTVSNTLFVLGVAGAFYLIALATLFLLSTLIEF